MSWNHVHRKTPTRIGIDQIKIPKSEITKLSYANYRIDFCEKFPFEEVVGKTDPHTNKPISTQEDYESYLMSQYLKYATGEELRFLRSEIDYYRNQSSLLKERNIELQEKNSRLTQEKQAAENRLNQIVSRQNHIRRRIKNSLIALLVVSAFVLFVYLLATQKLPLYFLHLIEISYASFWLIVCLQSRRHRRPDWENRLYTISSSLTIVIGVLLMFLEALT